MSVYLSVCLSAGISHKPQSKFHQISCTCYPWRWRQRNTLCTFGFVNGVMFSRNKANGPESKMTRMFRSVRPLSSHSHQGRSLLSPTASCFVCCRHIRWHCNVRTACKYHITSLCIVWLLAVLVVSCCCQNGEIWPRSHEENTVADDNFKVNRTVQIRPWRRG